MKMPIEWHEESLKNMQAYLVREKEDMKRAIERVRELEKACFIHETQIKEAKRLGKGGFDSDRFMQKPNKTTK